MSEARQRRSQDGPPEAIALSLFAARIAAICDEMGAALRRAAFSPNIRDRLDFSCAVFDARGQLCAQAAHVPVHLGSMAFAMADVVGERDWHPEDQLIFNDPYLGGTHLPDITLVAPVFVDQTLIAFVANRAHHADIGADAPGSMPVSTVLDQEGVVIAPCLYCSETGLNADLQQSLEQRLHNISETAGDLAAQASANRVGAQRLQELIEPLGTELFDTRLDQLNDYAERMARQALHALPAGHWCFWDQLDDDGLDGDAVTLRVQLSIANGAAQVDLCASDDQVPGNLNCPLAVTAAAVHYVFRCLMPAATPACAGSMRPIKIATRPGSLLEALRPAAVVAGNVETSQRIVDLILGALAQALPERIPAASQGSMNNVAMGASGDQAWAYYETIGGGAGAGAGGRGLSGRHCHMTNTLNTPVEVLESHYPLRVLCYQLRRGSGGRGQYPGGDGVHREYQFLAAAQVTVLSERRRLAPWGLQGGRDGACGENRIDGVPRPGKFSVNVGAGQTLSIKTPGGGGWGHPDHTDAGDKPGGIARGTSPVR